MLDDDQRHPGPIGHRVEQLAACIESACGRANAHDKESPRRCHGCYICYRLMARLPGGRLRRFHGADTPVPDQLLNQYAVSTKITTIDPKLPGMPLAHNRLRSCILAARISIRVAGLRETNRPINDARSARLWPFHAG
jgi:hypothetical protein